VFVACQGFPDIAPWAENGCAAPFSQNTIYSFYPLSIHFLLLSSRHGYRYLAQRSMAGCRGIEFK
jgi:hypothetical protein